MKTFFALKLAKDLYQETQKMPLPYPLKDQYLRACSSIALNLSEGSAKPTVADRRKFYFTALGSQRESHTILELSNAPSDVIQKSDFLGICIYRLCQKVK